MERESDGKADVRLLGRQKRSQKDEDRGVE